ncbi:MAG TPA: hypothetical protein VLB47_01750 [Solirubrobacteraceae bacterium]|nr:hypothetical protein [Solirubrobacteraceae bacterium]
MKRKDTESTRTARERAERQAVAELRAALVRPRREIARAEHLARRLVGLA